ncbi:methionine--tRNA ligase [Candidatus Rhabdochlamydia porcellionis]|uniref:Methionine--tRNA ligase n=1 Tax=Candidatus Rhabdochlamydia porcellionis TaxID=225148 RepID=A0ABX8YZY0_9BACT|nr:methionine--tRNA ligase [Candidatus Rhabdochlamydia porcellionis]QZA58965.1 Methionine--tRNA ligase [Candidatus Rhabdochlamydia porcellionis]
MSQKILITSALPYANGPLHFGHIAGAYLPADCYARFMRLCGHDVLYVCGSDEYGIAITLSAELAKHSPQEHVDLFHAINQRLFSQLNFSFDHYSRTTWPKHKETTQQFFLDLLHNGYIEEKITNQLYSEKEGKFLADRYVMGTCPKCQFSQARGDECQRCGANYEATDLIQPISKISGLPLVLKSTTHWFLRFDFFKQKLSDWLISKDWKPNVLHFASSYVEDLKGRSITRDMDWGIPVPLPNAQGKVFYVWFDAPIGYISATKEWAENRGKPEEWKKYWFDPTTKLVQFVGKDNIPFHALFFPAMIMGQNQPYKLVDELPANEFYNLEGKQFSKSDNWYIELELFFKSFSADQIRYTIAANAPETQDSEFTWKDFQMRCNVELLGKYGNLINRVLVFTKELLSAKVPPRLELMDEDQLFLDKIKNIVKQTETAYASFHLRKASQLIMELAQAGNVYFDLKKPWILARSPATFSQMQTTISCCLECLKALALISCPIIPQSAQKVFLMLGFEGSLEKANWYQVLESTIAVDTALPEPKILFNKIEDETIVEQQKKLYSHALEKPLKNIEVSIDDVRKLDLRVAQITAVERVPKSKKLLKLSLDLGIEKRQIVSGIGEKISDLLSLIGKKIVIIANLKPTKIMGIESQGMLLSADTEQGPEPLEVSLAAIGAKIS